MVKATVISPNGTRSDADRKRASRARTSHAYDRARGAAERHVVALMIEQHPRIYDNLVASVDAELRKNDHRSIRQARIRSACAAWFRRQRPEEWTRLLDAEKAARANSATTVTRRSAR